MDDTQSPLMVPVVINPAGPQLKPDSDVFLVAEIECPAQGVPQAFLLFAPRDNKLMLAAPCGCHSSVQLTELIVRLSLEMAAGRGHDSGGSSGHNGGGRH